MNLYRRFFFVSLFLFAASFLFVRTTSMASTDEASLQAGKTWYQLALALQIDSVSLRTAEQMYRSIDETTASEQELSAAQAGIQQTSGRLENSDEMVRNVNPGIWTLFGDHSVFEKYDSHFELALDRAWSRVLEQMIFKDQPRLPVFPRCSSQDEGLCAILQDMVILSANENPRLRGVTNDMLGQLKTWEQFSTVSHVPQRSETVAVRNILPEETILVADITIHPEIHRPEPVAHVAIEIYEWHTQSDQWTRIAFSEDVGIDVTDRWAHSYIYAIVLIFLAALFSVWIRLSESKVLSVLWTGVFIAIGMSVMATGVEFLDGFQPAMSDLALTPTGNRLAEIYPWAIAFAVLWIAAPALISILTISIVKSKTAGLISFEVAKQRYLSIPASVGVNLMLTTHLPTVMGSFGLLLAVSLLLCTTATTFILASMIEDFLDEEADSSREMLAFFFALVVGTTVIVLFFHGTAPILYTPLGLVLLGMAVALRSSSSKPQDEADPKEIEEIAPLQGEKGTLESPIYVHREATPFDQALDLLSGSKSTVNTIVVYGESGSGKTSYVQELLRQVQYTARTAKKRVRILSTENVELDRSSSESSGTPYATIIDLLGDILSFEKLMSQQEKRDSLSTFAQEFGDSALEIIPGVGLLMGILPEEDNETLTNDKLIRDVERTIRAKLNDCDLIWFIDDIQCTDSESLDIIFELVKRLEMTPPTHSLHIIGTETVPPHQKDLSAVRPPTFQPLQEQLNERYNCIPLHNLTQEEIPLFLLAYGIESPHNAFVQWVWSRVTKTADIKSVLKCLSVEHEGFRLSNGASLPTEEELRDLQDLIPDELLKLEELRLEALSDDDLSLLILAAQLGRNFDVNDLAVGTNMPRLHLLHRLRHLEQEAQLLLDRDEDDLFSFELDSTRKVLLDKGNHRRAINTNRDLPPKITAEFHRNIASHLVRSRVQDPTIPSERIVYHAQKAGLAHRDLVHQYTLEAAEEAARVFSWKRAEMWITKANDLSFSLPEQRARLQLVQAKMRTGLGDNKNQTLGLQDYWALVKNDHIDRRRCLLYWLRINFDRRAKGYPDILANIPTFAGLIWTQPYVHETLRFYELLSHFYTNHPNAAATTDEAYRQLINDLDGLKIALLSIRTTTKIDVQYKENLLARIENFTGQSWAGIRAVQPNESTRAIQHFQYSIALKKKWNDLDGQALTYGSMARYYRGKGDLDEAIQHFELDLEVMEQAGTEGQYRSSILSQLGALIHQKSQLHSDPLLLNEARDKMNESLTMAVNLNQSINIGFAVGPLIQYSCELGLPPQTWQLAIDAIRSGALEDVPPYAKSAAQTGLQNALSTPFSQQDPELTSLLQNLYNRI